MILLIPLLLILPMVWGIDGVFWAGPLSDGVAVIIVVIFAVREMRKLTELEKQQQKRN